MIEKQKLNQLNIELLNNGNVHKLVKISIPLNVRPMFIRRYNQTLRATKDKNKAKTAALSFIKTRFKKIRGKWIER